MGWHRRRVAIHVIIIYAAIIAASFLVARQSPVPSFDEEAVPVFGEADPPPTDAPDRRGLSLGPVLDALNLATELYKSVLNLGLPGLGLHQRQAEDEHYWVQLLVDFVYLLTDVRLTEPFTFLRTTYPMLSLVVPPGPGTQPSYVMHLPEVSPPALEDPPDAKAGEGEEQERTVDDLWLGAEHPQVLIYHTHTQESYWDAVIEATGDSQPRDPFIADARYNVLRVGTELARELKDAYGVGVIHVTDYFDTLPGGSGMNRVGAYARSAEKVAVVLEQYPTVSMVLDVHRDATPREVTAFTAECGETWARVMIVLGTDKHLEHPHWPLNAALAKDFARVMEVEYPGLYLRTLTRDYRYNQHLSPGALLLEVGGIENTLEEALATARMLARVVAILLHEGVVPDRR